MLPIYNSLGPFIRADDFSDPGEAVVPTPPTIGLCNVLYIATPRDATVDITGLGVAYVFRNQDGSRSYNGAVIF